jgi:CRP/FNR family transcriptional regulator
MNWCAEKALASNSKLNGSPIRLKLSYSHEEIAEMIGTSRETVTRMLKDFRERGLITLKGSDLVIPSYNNLERTIGTRGRSRPIL